MILFQLSTIWAETSDNARSAARSLVLGGLSEKHHGLNNFWMADRINVSPYLEIVLKRILSSSHYLDLICRILTWRRCG